jgi:hypothetical protein
VVYVATATSSHFSGEIGRRARGLNGHIESGGMARQ